MLSGDRSKRFWDAHKSADILIMNFEAVFSLH